jgi:2-C-methyl-D-erythritol 4-phosphate cytidylyltransferase
MHQTFAVVPAAGRGLRMGARQPKQFLMLKGKPVLAHTIEKLIEAPFISGIVLVVPREFVMAAQRILLDYCSCSLERAECSHSDSGGRLTGRRTTAGGAEKSVTIDVIAGGKERQDSVFNALCILPGQCEWVLIHDGVRPFVSAALLQQTWEAAQASGAAIAALPATDTVKRVADRRVVETLPREQIILVQTPQVFRKELILRAYMQAQNQGWMGTDDASFVERLKIGIHVVGGEYANIKVTTPADVDWATWYLG